MRTDSVSSRQRLALFAAGVIAATVFIALSIDFATTAAHAPRGKHLILFVAHAVVSALVAWFAYPAGPDASRRLQRIRPLFGPSAQAVDQNMAGALDSHHAPAYRESVVSPFCMQLPAGVRSALFRGSVRGLGEDVCQNMCS